MSECGHCGADLTVEGSVKMRLATAGQLHGTACRDADGVLHARLDPSAGAPVDVVAWCAACRNPLPESKALLDG